jgi:hypothetical protein
MSDIIDINVSKTVETIDIVANFEHPNIEITAIESVDNVEINAVPNVVQVNINTVIGSGADWGEIDGTLSDQTDLQDALDLKANTSELGAVAFSNDYNDLDNLPTIPEAVTKTSDLINDGEDGVNPFITLEDIPPIDISTLVPYTGATQDVDLGENGISAGFFKFDTTPTDIPEVQGAMFWDEDDNTVDVILNGYRMKIGEDTFYPVKNQSGSTITKGTNVKFAGTVGSSGRLLILPFLANGTDPSYVYMGVTAEDIADGEDGKVLWFGRLRGLNTNAFNEGDILYASTTSAGGFQTTIPTGNNNLVQVAAVIKKSVNQGVIFIRPQIEPLLFKPENVANKSTTTTLGTSNTLYPTQNAVKVYADTKVDKVTTSGVERAYIINPDGSQGTKATSDFGGAWGDITGDLSDQTDLQDALELKLDKSTTPSIIYATDSAGSQVEKPISEISSNLIHYKNHYFNLAQQTGTGSSVFVGGFLAIPANILQAGDMIKVKANLGNMDDSTTFFLTDFILSNAVRPVYNTQGRIALSSNNRRFAGFERNYIRVLNSSTVEIMNSGSSTFSDSSIGVNATMINQNGVFFQNLFTEDSYMNVYINCPNTRTYNILNCEIYVYRNT